MTVPMRFHYGYAANRRSTLTLPSGVNVNYGYDAADQLTGLDYV